MDSLIRWISADAAASWNVKVKTLISGVFSGFFKQIEKYKIQENKFPQKNYFPNIAISKIFGMISYSYFNAKR